MPVSSQKLGVTKVGVCAQQEEGCVVEISARVEGGRLELRLTF